MRLTILLTSRFILFHHHLLSRLVTVLNMLNFDFISIKSKIGVEFRRYALKREDVSSFDDFYKQIEKFHHLSAIPFVIFYVDPENFILPINNDDNLAKAIGSARHITLYDHKYHHTNSTARSNNNGISNEYQYHNNNHMQHAPPVILRRPFLKLFIEKKGTVLDYYNGNLSGKYKKNQPFKGISNLILPSHDQSSQRPSIGMPEDFRQVSSIIDVDIVPETCRRVRIVKHGSDRPLGFYIRDGTYKRMNSQGQLELVTGIFISRLVPGGLAESTGLLAVNDEVLEVNGIQVTHGKTLDQVTDMMVANSSNLIITIRPGKSNEMSWQQ
jgi:partitioning defective protein 6